MTFIASEAVGIFAKLKRWLVSLRYLSSTRERAIIANDDAVELRQRLSAHAVDQSRFRSEYASFRSEYASFRSEYASHVQGMGKEIADLRREILFQQRRLTRLSSDIAPPALTVAAPKAAQTFDRASDRLDSLYLTFEDVFRGTREDIKNRFAPYVSKIVAARSAESWMPVLDIGCGRGEWLELLKQNNISAYGIDANSMMVELSKSLGLDVRHADVLEHLSGLENASVSAVTAFHIIEHIPFEILIDVLDEALRVLAPGGVLILETPNPETIRVGATTFYNDPTHRNPIPPEPLLFIVRHRGFRNVELLRLHPYPESELFKGQDADTRRLNEMMFGPQDYAIIASRG